MKPERREGHKTNPVPDLIPGGTFLTAGRGFQAEHCGLAELRRHRLESGEAEVAGICRAKYQRGGSCAEEEL